MVYLKESYVPDEFADLLEEFILDQLKPVVLESLGAETALTNEGVKFRVEDFGSNIMKS